MRKPGEAPRGKFTRQRRRHRRPGPRGNLLRPEALRARDYAGRVFAEPCDLSAEAIRAKGEAKDAIHPCGSLLRPEALHAPPKRFAVASRARDCEGREPQGFLAKKGEFTLHSAQSGGFIRQFERALQQLTGLPFDLRDAANLSSQYPVPHETGFCRLVHQSSAGRQACDHDTRDAIQQCLTTRQAVIKTCHLGLTDVYVPLIVDDGVIGILSSGQFLTRPPTTDGYRRLCRRLVALGLDARKLEREYMRLPVCARERIEALANLLSLVNQYVTDARTRLSLLQTSGREDRINRACEFIERRLNEPLRLAMVAAAVNLSPSRFAHLFRDRTGMSFIRYIQTQRLNHATALLVETGLPAATVAQSVGFESQSHFNHLFRRRFGVSPCVYRLRYPLRATQTRSPRHSFKGPTRKHAMEPENSRNEQKNSIIEQDKRGRAC